MDHELEAGRPQARGVIGRPTTSRKGDVDARILEAATRLFLTLGFDGTSCDQVALDARAGKASIYARYANKAALFAAVIETNLAGLFSAQAATYDIDAPLRQRMTAAGLRVLETTLQPDVVALVRLLVVQAPRLPGVVVGAGGEQMPWQGGVQAVAEAIAARSTAVDRIERSTGAAAMFIDLLLAPALMRALLGEDPAMLLQKTSQFIGTAIDMVQATGACEGWE